MSNLLHHPTQLLIDFDGTLFDTKNTMKQALITTCQNHHHPTPTDQCLEYAIAKACDLEGTLKAVNPNLPDQGPILKNWMTSYERSYDQFEPKLTRPFSGVMDVIETLHRRGFNLSVVSNKRHHHIENRLSEYKLTSYFGHIFSLDSGYKPKPCPDLFFECIVPTLGVTDPLEYLMIGDSATDLQFSINCGMPCIWAQYGYGEPNLCRTLSHRKRITSPHDLLALV